MGKFSIVINGSIWLPSNPDSNGVFSLSNAKLSLLSRGESVPDHHPMYPALLTPCVDTIHVVSDRKQCSVNFAVSCLDPIMSQWYPVMYYRVE